jgi:hypothetical protein
VNAGKLLRDVKLEAQQTEHCALPLLPVLRA